METIKKQPLYKTGDAVIYKSTGRKYIVMQEMSFVEKYNRFEYAIYDIKNQTFHECYEHINN